MAGTVTADLTIISLCEALTGWTAVGGTDSLNDPTVFDQRQGSYCIQNYNAAAANRGADYDFGVDTDLSDTVLYFWFAFSKVSHATNPMRIRVTDAAGNWREWNIFTKATLPHLSWIAWALKTTVAYDAQSATPPTMTAIRKVGWRIDAVKAKVYIYWDAWRYGTGLSIKAGTDASPAIFEDFFTADSDSANAYGVIEKYNGVYFVQGQLKIGSLTVDESTYFKDLNQVIQFKSIKGEPSGFYEIKGQRASTGTGTTKIFFGEKSGSAGISGLFIRASLAMKWKLTMSDVNITEFGFYGCTFVNADTTAGQAYSTLKEFLNTNFMSCAEMLPDTGIVKFHKFVSSPSRACRIASVSHHITDSGFISCQIGSEITVDGDATITFSGLNFSGNTFDVEKSSPTGTLTIKNTNGSNASSSTITGGGSIQFITSAIHKLTGMVQNTEVTYVDSSLGTDLFHVEDVDSGGASTFTYDATVAKTVDILIHHVNYVPILIKSVILGAGGGAIPITQYIDRTYSNP